MPPTNANGKICYIEIPSDDIERSAAFYARVFGWNIRQRGDGATAFDDGSGEVSGAWRTGRRPASHAGFVIYIMVDGVAAAIEAAVSHGGSLIQPIGGDPGEITARITDPSGNLIGLYQEPAK
jgi:uncharacterized protein